MVNWARMIVTDQVDSLVEYLEQSARRRKSAESGVLAVDHPETDEHDQGDGSARSAR